METQMEPSLDGWIDVCQQLRPYQSFVLIGLLFLKPRAPLSILTPANIVNDENARSAEKWSESRFRQLLLFYCEKHNKPAVQAGATLIEKTNAIRGLAALLVSTYAVPLGIAVAFLYWAMGKNLNGWCIKYAEKKYNGKGKYTGDFPEKEIEGFFDVTFRPQITELVDDPEAYPLEGYKIRIKVKSETDGRLKVSTAKQLNSIQLNFAYDKRNVVDFRDTQTNIRLSGRVDNVSHVVADGPTVLRFISDDFGPSRQRLD